MMNHRSVSPPASSLDAAIEYTRRGWCVIPIPHARKNPGFEEWQNLRLTEAEIPQHFNGRPQNIGVLLGKPSQWLIDVDLDHDRCVELADNFLPQTAAEFGRARKPRSHRLFYVNSPVQTLKRKSTTGGMLVEVRSTGLQTVFPPSMHPDGEAIRWESEYPEPAVVEPSVIYDSVNALADAVLSELGEEPHRAEQPLSRAVSIPHPPRPDEISSCVSAMMRMRMDDHNDGSARLFAAACRTVECDLSDSDAITAIREYESQKPFPRKWSDAQIRDRLRDAERHTERGKACYRTRRGSRAQIILGTDEHRVIRQSADALKSDPDVYQRGNELVRVLRPDVQSKRIRRSENSLTIQPLPAANLRDRLTQHANFVRELIKDDEVVLAPAHPTGWLVNGVLERGDWPGIRHLTSVSEVPVLRPDGSIWQTPGYDEQTGVLFHPSRKFPHIPSDVSIDDADVAVDALLDIVADFPFESDEYRSAWLSGLLTPFARFAFDGPSPFFLVDANVRGAGKSLLVRTIGYIVFGHDMPASGYAHKAEEMRKVITTAALAGDRVMHLDNISGFFGNDALDRALTSTIWKDRVLGRNEQVELPLHVVWYGTGNNVAIAADTVRRIVHIRLDVMEENPEERTGFTHPDLLQWVAEHHAEFVTHALTILAAYSNAGRPDQGLATFGSFEGWSATVRNALVWCGQPDPCLTRKQLSEVSDTAKDAQRQLLHAWQEYDLQDNGLVLSTLVDALYKADPQPRDEASAAMRDALENLVPRPSGKHPSAREIGNKMKAFRRRVVDGVYVDFDPNEYDRRGVVWRLGRIA